jgi:hypothetical protein
LRTRTGLGKGTVLVVKNQRKTTFRARRARRCSGPRSHRRSGSRGASGEGVCVGAVVSSCRSSLGPPHPPTRQGGPARASKRLTEQDSQASVCLCMLVCKHNSQGSSPNNRQPNTSGKVMLRQSRSESERHVHGVLRHARSEKERRAHDAAQATARGARRCPSAVPLLLCLHRPGSSAAQNLIPALPNVLRQQGLDTSPHMRLGVALHRRRRLPPPSALHLLKRPVARG